MPSRRSVLAAGATSLGVATWVGAGTGTSETVTGSWPEHGRTADNTSHTAASGPTETVAQRWRHDTKLPVRKTPTVADGRVFVGGLDRMTALDAATGRVDWKRGLGTDSRFNDAAAAVADGTVYVGFDDTLYAMATTDGSQRWRTTLDEPIDAPTVVGDTVYVTDENALLALATDGGRRRFRVDSTSYVGPPAVADGTVFALVGVPDETVALAAFDASDGTERWRTELLSGPGPWGRGPPAPAVADGTVYTGAYDGTVHAISATDGSRQWTFDPETTRLPRAPTDDDPTEPAPVRATPAVDDTSVYVAHGDGHLYALDRGTGEQAWTFRSWGRFAGGSAVTDDTVYVGSRDSFVYALDTETGRRRWEFSTGEGIQGSAPAVVDGHVFVGSGDEHVYALGEDR